MKGTVLPGSDAAIFLHALGGDGPFLLQTYPDRKGTATRGLTFAKLGTLRELTQDLVKRNERGAAVAVLANTNDGTHRRKIANIRGIRTLFVDLDGAPILPIMSAPFAPHIVTETSPGRYHAFWLVHGYPVGDFVRVQRALAARFGGDPSMADVTRCVRVPGFWHQKHAPFLSRIHSIELRPAIPYADFAEAFALTVPHKLPPPVTFDRIPKGSRNPTFFDLAKAASRRGIAADQELVSLKTLNAEKCDPPMDDDELEGIVARAYALAVIGYASIPFACFDSAAYQTLDGVAVQVLMLAYRRFNGSNNGRLSLTWAQCRHAIPLKRKAFERGRTRVVESGLMTIARPATKAWPGHKPQPALYRLTHVLGSPEDPNI